MSMFLKKNQIINITQKVIMTFLTNKIRTSSPKQQVNVTYVDLDNNSGFSAVLNLFSLNKKSKQPTPEFFSTFVKIGYKTYPIISGTRLDLNTFESKDSDYVSIDDEVFIIKTGVFGNKYLAKI